VDDKLRELVAGRGKKGTDRSRHIESLVELRQLAAEAGLGEALDCKILFAIVAAIFDYNPNIATSMKADMWEKYVLLVTYHVNFAVRCYASAAYVVSIYLCVCVCQVCEFCQNE